MSHTRKKAIAHLKSPKDQKGENWMDGEGEIKSSPKVNVRKPKTLDGHTIGGKSKKTAKKFDKGKRKTLKVIGG
jgi:hypothetical protein